LDVELGQVVWIKAHNAPIDILKQRLGYPQRHTCGLTACRLFCGLNWTSLG
jgi:hypothetical protein